METGSAALKHADLLLSGDLAEFIRNKRSSGRSWDLVARDLWEHTNRKVDVTGVTVRKWAEQLGIEAAV